MPDRQKTKTIFQRPNITALTSPDLLTQSNRQTFSILRGVSLEEVWPIVSFVFGQGLAGWGGGGGSEDSFALYSERTGSKAVRN